MYALRGFHRSKLSSVDRTSQLAGAPSMEAGFRARLIEARSARHVLIVETVSLKQ